MGPATGRQRGVEPASPAVGGPEDACAHGRMGAVRPVGQTPAMPRVEELDGFDPSGSRRGDVLPGVRSVVGLAQLAFSRTQPLSSSIIRASADRRNAPGEWPRPLGYGVAAGAVEVPVAPVDGSPDAEGSQGLVTASPMPAPATTSATTTPRTVDAVLRPSLVLIVPSLLSALPVAFGRISGVPHRDYAAWPTRVHRPAGGRQMSLSNRTSEDPRRFNGDRLPGLEETLGRRSGHDAGRRGPGQYRTAVLY